MEITYNEKELKKILVKALELCKEEIDNRASIKNNMGIDLANYENKYYTAVVKLLEFLLHDNEDVDWGNFVLWWLIEDVEKKIYDENNKVIENIETPEGFVNYMLRMHNEKWNQ